MAQLYGVDISEFQGVINWDALNEASNFVIIRASFGTARKDYQFNRNQSEARRVRDQAGPLGIGYYYYAYPTLLDPATSANYFLDNLGPIQNGEVLALDLEGNVGNDPVGWSLGFLNHVYDRTTIRALIYLNQSLMNSHDWSRVINANYGLWLAQYDNNKESPTVASPWPVVALKQWTDADLVAGINGKVDGDTFYGDFDTWNAYGLQPSQPPSPPETLPPAPLPEPPPSTETTTTTTTTTVPPSPEPVPDPLPVEPPVPSPVPSSSPFWSTIIALIKGDLMYSKFYVAIIGGLVQYLTVAFGSHNVYVVAVIALLTAAGVYVTPNTPRNSIQ